MDEKLKERIKGAPRAFYINLGVNSGLARECFDRGHLVIGHPEVSHETASLIYEKPESEVRGIIRQEIQDCSGRTASEAKSYPSQVMDLYTGGDWRGSWEEGCTGDDALWITFWNMRLWWTFAKGRAQPGRNLDSGFYPRANHPGRTVEGVHGPKGDGWDYHWRNTTGWLSKSLAGKTLYRHQLGFITSRCEGTICLVGEERLEYLRSRIIGASTGESEADLISHLDENQMEWFVEQLFCKMGWNRISPLGGTQKDIDMVVEKDGVWAFVQVKTRTGEAIYAKIKHLAEDFRATSDDGQKAEFYLAYHTPENLFSLNEEVWNRERLAKMAVEHGLSDWLRKRVG
ncbi:MAG: hypothetical protein MPK06_01875 [Alphaproteobacteria bacterium]|nr:hypothetical protein [Alphaproteobacteria bacterium]MDA8004492.1 hypothetical protein [Alphaproteobacteria bacterium]MDA8005277.1 hypothetical protein [Alphaproteobacteria bacterium]MDA8012696.1 hypothetical protein [Alphaproteobacteria bacterium]